MMHAARKFCVVIFRYFLTFILSGINKACSVLVANPKNQTKTIFMCFSRNNLGAKNESILNCGLGLYWRMYGRKEFH